MPLATAVLLSARVVAGGVEPVPDPLCVAGGVPGDEAGGAAVVTGGANCVCATNNALTGEPNTAPAVPIGLSVVLATPLAISDVAVVVGAGGEVVVPAPSLAAGASPAGASPAGAAGA